MLGNPEILQAVYKYVEAFGSTLCETWDWSDFVLFVKEKNVESRWYVRFVQFSSGISFLYWTDALSSQ